jgi:hypothetical protein
MKIEVADKTLFLTFKLHQSELYISEAYGSRILEDFLILGVAEATEIWIVKSISLLLASYYTYYSNYYTYSKHSIIRPGRLST